MPVIPIEGAFDDIDPIMLLMEAKIELYKEEYGAMSLEEVAALNDITLLYTEMEDSYACMSKSEDGKDFIIIDPSLKQEEKIKQFYRWFAVTLVERSGSL